MDLLQRAALPEDLNVLNVMTGDMEDDWDMHTTVRAKLYGQLMHWYQSRPVRPSAVEPGFWQLLEGESDDHRMEVMLLALAACREPMTCAAARVTMLLALDPATRPADERKSFDHLITLVFAEAGRAYMEQQWRENREN